MYRFLACFKGSLSCGTFTGGLGWFEFTHRFKGQGPDVGSIMVQGLRLERCSVPSTDDENLWDLGCGFNSPT